MANLTRDRFKEAPWFNPKMKVTVGGLGSIGSWLTLMLGRLINDIYVYDFDRVEENNLGGQFYGQGNIGEEKEQATKKIAGSLNPNVAIHRRGKFEEGSPVTDICFACFDNMEARRHMFDSWATREGTLFIDGRLTAEQFWVYTVTPDRIEEYVEGYLLEDEDFDDLPCSYKSTTHVSAMLASSMTVAFTNYLHNQIVEDIRDLPFETSFIATMNMYKTDNSCLVS